MIIYLEYVFSYIYIFILSTINRLITTEKKDYNNNIIVSFTTIPSRSPYIINTINSILNQTVLPRKIYIGIPIVSSREPLLEYNLSNVIQTNKMIKIVYYNEDSGPIMKLLTGLDKCNTDDMIITIDDDTIYEKHLIEILSKNAMSDFNSVHCTIGRDKYSKKKYGTYTKCTLRTLEGYGGVIYRKHFFNNFNIINNKCFRTNDDLVISAYLKNNNIKINKVSYFIREPFCRYLFTSQSNPLYMINESNNVFNIAANELLLFEN